LLTPSSVAVTDGGSGYRPEHTILIPSSHVIRQLLLEAIAEIKICLCFKPTVLQIILENHELCKYAKISLHIHIIVDLNQNIA